MLAETEWQAGNSAAAIAQFRKVLERDSRNIMALNGLGYLLADQANQPDEALKYAQQAKDWRRRTRRLKTLSRFPQTDVVFRPF